MLSLSCARTLPNISPPYQRTPHTHMCKQLTSTYAAPHHHGSNSARQNNHCFQFSVRRQATRSPLVNVNKNKHNETSRKPVTAQRNALNFMREVKRSSPLSLSFSLSSFVTTTIQFFSLKKKCHLCRANAIHSSLQSTYITDNVLFRA